MSDNHPIEDYPPRQTGVRRNYLVLSFIFPFLLAGGAYSIGYAVESGLVLRKSFFEPIDPLVYGWLLGMVILSLIWLLGEFFTIISRETITKSLQWDAVLSNVTAMVFTGAAGYQLGQGDLYWWIVVPWGAAVLDGITAGWFGINNAAQKPFGLRHGS